jgi:hypothetical protein
MKVKMTKDILYTIATVQSYKNYLINRNGLEGNIDWYTETEKLFSELHTPIPKTKSNFETVLNFQITNEMNSTLFQDLGKFEIYLNGYK